MEAVANPFSLTNQPVFGYCPGISGMGRHGRISDLVGEKRQKAVEATKPGRTRKLPDPANQFRIG
jgi:hypothetical protein